MSDELLKLRIPDQDYPLELVASIAAALVRDQATDDYKLAVGRALRLLDTANRVLERYKKERGSCSGAGQRELEKRIPFGEGLKQITGADRPGKAEMRLVDRLLHREHEYVDYEELKRASGSEVPNGHDPHAEPEAKTRPTNSGEIKEALDRVREKGFTREEVDRLRKRYLEGTKRVRAKNLPRKKKNAAK